MVGLGGPVMGTVLPEDLVVLETGSDGPVSNEIWSCKDLFPMGILLCLCEGIFLMVVGILWTWRSVDWAVCDVGVPVPVPAVGESLCRQDESVTTSAGEPSVLLVSSDMMLPLVSSVLHSLLLGKGMDRLLQMITCGLPCSQLRAASLYVIGSLGQSEYEAVLVSLSGESGLSTSNFSLGLLGVVSAEQVSAGV